MQRLPRDESRRERERDWKNALQLYARGRESLFRKERTCNTVGKAGENCRLKGKAGGKQGRRGGGGKDEKKRMQWERDACRRRDYEEQEQSRGDGEREMEGGRWCSC